MHSLGLRPIVQSDRRIITSTITISIIYTHSYKGYALVFYSLQMHVLLCNIYLM